jgi:hypothetical protein
MAAKKLCLMLCTIIVSARPWSPHLGKAERLSRAFRALHCPDVQPESPTKEYEPGQDLCRKSISLCVAGLTNPLRCITRDDLDLFPTHIFHSIEAAVNGRYLRGDEVPNLFHPDSHALLDR